MGERDLQRGGERKREIGGRRLRVGGKYRVRENRYREGEKTLQR